MKDIIVETKIVLAILSTAFWESTWSLLGKLK